MVLLGRCNLLALTEIKVGFREFFKAISDLAISLDCSAKNLDSLFFLFFYGTEGNMTQRREKTNNQSQVVKIMSLCSYFLYLSPQNRLNQAMNNRKVIFILLFKVIRFKDLQQFYSRLRNSKHYIQDSFKDTYIFPSCCKFHDGDSMMKQNIRISAFTWFTIQQREAGS